MQSGAVQMRSCLKRVLCMPITFVKKQKNRRMAGLTAWSVTGTLQWPRGPGRKDNSGAHLPPRCCRPALGPGWRRQTALAWRRSEACMLRPPGSRNCNNTAAWATGPSSRSLAQGPRWAGRVCLGSLQERGKEQRGGRGASWLRGRLRPGMHGATEQGDVDLLPTPPSR